MHHAFRLTDQESGRVLNITIEIHTRELGRYSAVEADLAKASMRDRWLYCFLHAHEYEPETVSGSGDAIGNANDHENSRDNRG